MDKLEVVGIALIIATVFMEFFEIMRKYVEDLVTAYKRGRDSGKSFF
jgi:hypothetical protein